MDSYLLLLEQLKAEEKVIKAFNKRFADIARILQNRKREMKQPKLTFSVLDPMRNQAARRLRLEKFAKMEEREHIAKKEPADFLAPYLIYYVNRKPTKEESEVAMQGCLEHVKTYYLDMLNELQRRYDELTSETKSLKKFLIKFQDQFDDFDYDRLIKEG